MLSETPPTVALVVVGYAGVHALCDQTQAWCRLMPGMTMTSAGSVLQLAYQLHLLESYRLDLSLYAGMLCGFHCRLQHHTSMRQSSIPVRHDSRESGGLSCAEVQAASRQLLQSAGKHDRTSMLPSQQSCGSSAPASSQCN